MGLPDVVDAVIQDFTDSSVTCPILYGPAHEAEHAEPPRIVVIPTDDTYEAAHPVQNSDFPDGTMFDGQNPRPVLTRVEGGRAIIWAAGSKQDDPEDQERADYDAVHALINQFILSLHRTNPGNFRVLRGTTTETTRVVRRGYVYTLMFAIESPIIDVAWPTQSGVGVANSVEMDFPSGQTETVVIPMTSTVFTADALTDVFTSVAHGLTDDTQVTLTNNGGELPDGILEGLVYFIVNSDTDTFQLSLSLGGSAVGITTDGTGTNTAHS